MGCWPLKSGELDVLRFHELGPINRKVFVKHFPEFLGQDDGNGARVTSVNRNWKRPGVAIVAVNGAVGFPNAVGVTSGVIVVSNEKNFGPKVSVERVLGFHGGEVVAGGDDTTIKDNQLVFAWREKNGLLRSATEGGTSEQECAVIRELG